MDQSNLDNPGVPRYKRSHQAVASSLDDAICLFHLKTCEYMALNETGSSIWEFLQEPLTLQEISSLLASEYDISADECIAEVELWIQLAIKYGVIDVIS